MAFVALDMEEEEDENFFFKDDLRSSKILARERVSSERK
jgi:hypothetical protein